MVQLFFLDAIYWVHQTQHHNEEKGNVRKCRKLGVLANSISVSKKQLTLTVEFLRMIRAIRLDTHLIFVQVLFLLCFGRMRRYLEDVCPKTD